MCFNQTKWKWNKYFTQSILKYTKPQALPLSNRDCIFGVQMISVRGGEVLILNRLKALPRPLLFSSELIKDHFG